MPYHALSLFSGGLDSILATRLIMAQGLRVLGIHYVTPFFGKPHMLPQWQKDWGVELCAVDLGQAFVDMLAAGPAHGWGKTLNPCVDCKILMLSHARELLPQYGAQFLISGEVIGQRPMSQREDTLFAIRNAAGVRDLLVRPLCALHLPPTPMEISGLVDRSQLAGLHGRGRKGQLEMARKFGITVIPAQGGGCRLTERESARRYWPLLHTPQPKAEDFILANVGRQLWRGGHWLVLGRNEADSRRLEGLQGARDLVFRLVSVPGPLGLGRQLPGVVWDHDALDAAAATLAAFAPKARALGRAVEVEISGPESRIVRSVWPAHIFHEPPTWEEVRLAKADATHPPSSAP
jgi:tRNA-specific 2-thiouridylase